MEEATIKATDTNAETGRCEYCGKERPLDQLKQEAILRNGREHIGTYCRYDGCANFAQMSAEG